METPTRPFERYRTRSALFLMIYAVIALIAGIPNIMLVTMEEDRRILIILATSILVVSRFVGYIKLAGYALLEADLIKAHSLRISMALWVIVVVLLANAAVFLYRFGFTDMSVTAVSVGCIATAGVLITHLVASRERGMTRSQLMRMVSGVLIALGCANICITMLFPLAPILGLMTLFFGIYTERKSLMLAAKQTFAVASGAAGAGLTVYFLRWYMDPALLGNTAIEPATAIYLGCAMTLVGMGYYRYSRRLYAKEIGQSTVPAPKEHS